MNGLDVAWARDLISAVQPPSHGRHNGSHQEKTQEGNENIRERCSDATEARDGMGESEHCTKKHQPVKAECSEEHEESNPPKLAVESVESRIHGSVGLLGLCRFSMLRIVRHNVTLGQRGGIAMCFPHIPLGKPGGRMRGGTRS